MPNMKTLAQDDRAKLAKAYMKGGMAPYQAARNTGFCRVGLMQEAIRAMEGREAEEASQREEQDKNAMIMQYGSKADNINTSPEDEDISLQEDVEELCEDDEPETPQTIYPFLKSGEVKTEVKTVGILMTLQTERLMIRLYEQDGKQLFQLTERRTGHYLQLPQQVLRELKAALGLCLGAMNLGARGDKACE